MARARYEIQSLGLKEGWKVQKVGMSCLSFMKPGAYALVHFDRRGNISVICAGHEKDDAGVFKREHLFTRRDRHKREWLTGWLTAKEWG